MWNPRLRAFGWFPVLGSFLCQGALWAPALSSCSGSRPVQRGSAAYLGHHTTLQALISVCIIKIFQTQWAQLHLDTCWSARHLPTACLARGIKSFIWLFLLCLSALPSKADSWVKYLCLNAGVNVRMNTFARYCCLLPAGSTWQIWYLSCFWGML